MGLSWYDDPSERLEYRRFEVGRPREHTEQMAAEWEKVTLEVTMKSHGEIESGICEEITRFEREYMGRGPKDIARPLDR